MTKNKRRSKDKSWIKFLDPHTRINKTTGMPEFVGSEKTWKTLKSRVHRYGKQIWDSRTKGTFVGNTKTLY